MSVLFKAHNKHLRELPFSLFNVSLSTDHQPPPVPRLFLANHTHRSVDVRPYPPGLSFNNGSDSHTDIWTRCSALSEPQHKSCDLDETLQKQQPFMSAASKTPSKM